MRSVEGWGKKKRWQFGRRPEQGEGHAEDDEGRREDETGEEELRVANGVLEPLEKQRVDQFKQFYEIYNTVKFVYNDHPWDPKVVVGVA